MNSIDLAGPWHIRPDPDNAGLAQRWQRDPGPSDAWMPIAVPSGWQSVLGVKDPAVAWYRRTLRVPREWTTPGSRVWLRFDSIATDATVFINAEQVGRHTGNWAPFHIDITEALAGSGPDPVLTVRVDKIPAQPPIWIDGAPVFPGHITKGFHDILSIQTAGIWDGVHLERTGGLRAIPNGVSAVPNVDAQALHLRVELEPHDTAGTLECTVVDPAGATVATLTQPIAPGDTDISFRVAVPSPRLWWPEAPSLYTVNVALRDARGVDEHHLRIGFRTVKTGGPNNERLLLNGRPVFLSGVLDWGHEPETIAPTPSRDELRARFATLKAMGFNFVCLCMWYPPEYYFEIADELGMMLWQEHPVWKPWMGDELVEAFKTEFVKFFRRDANHASVVLVSGSCEHERFNAKLAEWWWTEARRRLPDRALQIQTAFFAWTDPEKTDLWDEHTYESAGRWVRYLDDLQAALKEKKPKPFIMGESVIYTSWPDTRALLDAARTMHRLKEDGDLPFYFPRGLAAFTAYERDLLARYGPDVVEALKQRSDAYNLRGRKFQMERYRAHANHAGHVMNHLRDVVSCRCGFRDDLNRWRFTPEQTRPWTGDTILLFQTPDQRTGFFGGQRPRCRVGVSNFGAAPFAERVHLTIKSRDKQLLDTTISLECPQGEVRWQSIDLPLPNVDQPTQFHVKASTTDSDVRNAWSIWVLPRTADPDAAPAIPDPLTLHPLSYPSASSSAPSPLSRPTPTPRSTLFRLAGLDFTDADDMHPDFEEHAYSSGWGLKVRTWTCPLPNPAVLTPRAAPWNHSTPIPDGARVIVAHKLTRALVDFMERGGRVVHLASKTLGSIPTQYVSLWGQVPLVVSDPYLGAGTEDAILELLDYDLNQRTVRAIPVGQLGIAEQVEPLVRLVWTHDMQERPKLLDSLFAARVGHGLLVASALDHTEDAGLWLLDRVVRFADEYAPDAGARVARLDPAEVRRWTLESQQR
jgi:hypothetical protein